MLPRLMIALGALTIFLSLMQDPPLTLGWIPGTWLLMRGWLQLERDRTLR
jgi:predicted benzoate:H+ symporter BenE